MVDVLKIFRATKEISFFPGWSRPEAETGYVFFDAPLEIGGVTETGLVLHGGCYETYPDCNVTFELRIAKSPGQRCLPMERIDWRSLSGGHSNIRGPASEWSGAKVSDTHLHEF
ncbi:hypothetical protein, partial [Salipiger aestuarii]|uniref:hypothetical protein n=1 Tax=Salipiger aestuarii TaxID=568098 RepID=UPI001CC2F729